MFSTTDFARSLVASLAALVIATTCVVAAAGPAMTNLVA